MVTKPKINNKRQRFLTHEEADTLLKSLKSKSQQLHDIALLSIQCGLRAGEIFDLTWGCVDFENKTLLLMDTKPVKSRTAFMTSDVTEMLKGKGSGSPNELVFKDRNGNKINEVSNAFSRTVKDLGLNEGIDDTRMRVYFHTLRHTYASWMVQNGEDLYTVQKLLGHSTIAMTERYSHLAPDTFKKAVKRFDSSLKDKKKRMAIINKKI